MVLVFKWYTLQKWNLTRDITVIVKSCMHNAVEFKEWQYHIKHFDNMIQQICMHSMYLLQNIYSMNNHGGYPKLTCSVCRYWHVASTPHAGYLLDFMYWLHIIYWITRCVKRFNIKLRTDNKQNVHSNTTLHNNLHTAENSITYVYCPSLVSLKRIGL